MQAPRMFLDEPLSSGLEIPVEHDRAHYLRNVMRLRAGDQVRLFNANDGEWSAHIDNIERRTVILKLDAQSRKPGREDGPVLYFAPLKRHRQEMLIEKAVELGVRALRPVITAHTVIERINPVRLRSRVVEAAEQCERLTLPELEESIDLMSLNSEGKVLMADERGGGMPILQALDVAPDAAFLIGPEGGFSEEERAHLHAQPWVQPITLGPTLLRAETAAIFALSVWRAWRDDEVEGEEVVESGMGGEALANPALAGG